mmetsp:Transcript_5395/g.8139  ORF Transcript_5395/g.8139 Transcript_5395/m.8139 type:complete len:84 (-) Transcript_5395:37-288(-)
MENEQRVNVDLYIPRKCSWTNCLLTAKDHASVQINVANVDHQTGLMNGTHEVFALAGFIRNLGEADEALKTLSYKKDEKNMAV